MKKLPSSGHGNNIKQTSTAQVKSTDNNNKKKSCVGSPELA